MFNNGEETTDHRPPRTKERINGAYQRNTPEGDDMSELSACSAPIISNTKARNNVSVTVTIEVITLEVEVEGFLSMSVERYSYVLCLDHSNTTRIVGCRL